MADFINDEFKLPYIEAEALRLIASNVIIEYSWPMDVQKYKYRSESSKKHSPYYTCCAEYKRYQPYDDSGEIRDFFLKIIEEDLTYQGRNGQLYHWSGASKIPTFSAVGQLLFPSDAPIHFSKAIAFGKARLAESVRQKLFNPTIKFSMFQKIVAMQAMQGKQLAALQIGKLLAEMAMFAKQKAPLTPQKISTASWELIS